jgi:hypothetical protein
MAHGIFQWRADVKEGINLVTNMQTSIHTSNKISHKVISQITPYFSFQYHEAAVTATVLGI